MSDGVVTLMRGKGDLEFGANLEHPLRRRAQGSRDDPPEDPVMPLSQVEALVVRIGLQGLKSTL